MYHCSSERFWISCCEKHSSSKWEVESTLTQVVLWIWKVYKCIKHFSILWNRLTARFTSMSILASSSFRLKHWSMISSVAGTSMKLLKISKDDLWWHTTTTESTQSPTSGLTWALETPFSISTWTETFHMLITWSNSTRKKYMTWDNHWSNATWSEPIKIFTYFQSSVCWQVSLRSRKVWTSGTSERICLPMLQGRCNRLDSSLSQSRTMVHTMKSCLLNGRFSLKSDHLQ